MKPNLVVVCLKWGNPYPPEYVNVLQRAVDDHLSYPHRFVCVTDSAAGLSAAVEAIDLPVIPLPREKWVPGIWPKLTIFQRGMFADDDVVLYLDVDILIAQSLDPFVDLVAEQGGLRIIREWNPDIWRLLPVGLRPDRGGNSSIVGFRPRDQYHLYDDFAAAPDEIFHRDRNDQNFINRRAQGKRYWPEDWAMSFRRQCVQHWPLNLAFPNPTRPERGKVFVFHGSPNPTDLVEDGDYRWGRKWRFGYGPVPWVQQYWRKYRQPVGGAEVPVERRAA